MKKQIVNIFSCLTIAFLLGACSMVPAKRPYLQEYKSKVNEVKIYVVNSEPVNATYFYQDSSAAG